MSTRNQARVESDDASSSAGQQGNLSDDAQEGQRERDAEFWFDDGSVLLVAGGFEFKVYRAVLSARSPVFKDMFSFPQPTSSSDSHDLPVVHLTDSPEDLRHILRACMPTEWSSELPVTKNPSVYAVSAYIRLGHKYQMSSLFESAVKCLKTSYPSTLHCYRSALSMRGSGLWGPFAIHVIQIARLIEDDSMLPVALMVCSELGEAAMDGFKREDGSVDHLSRDDLKLCLSVTVPLVMANVEMCLEVFKVEVSKDCLRPVMCRNAFNESLEECTGYTDGPLICTGLDALLDIAKIRLCESCYEMAATLSEDAERRIWSWLPKLMGVKVDGWG